MWICSNVLYQQVQSWLLRDLDRPLQWLTNILYISNALRRRDRSHNVEITTLLFTRDVCGFF